MSFAVTKSNSLAEEISLQEIALEDRHARQANQMRLLWDHRRFLVRVTAIGLLASGIFAFTMAKSYTSTAQLMPPDPQPLSGFAMMASMATKGASGGGSIIPDMLGLNTTGALFVGMLRSDATQSHLVEQFDLRKVYSVRLEQDARKILDRQTTISEDRKSGLISISVTDHSPERAAALTRAYVDELNALISELSTSAAHRERVFLEERLKVVKHDLDDASSDLAQFSSQNTTVDIQTMGRAVIGAAGSLAGALIAAQSELEGLRQIYSDDNPRVRALTARVAELRKELDKLDGPRSNIPGANVQGDLNDPWAPAGDIPYPSLHNLPLLGVKYADYYRRAKIQETVFELLTQQYELARIQEAKETPTVKVLDRPKIAEKKSSPHRLLLTLLGGFLFFCTGLVWVFSSAGWHAADPEDPRKILAIEIARIVKTRARKTLQFSRNGHGPKPQGPLQGHNEFRVPTNGTSNEHKQE